MTNIEQELTLKERFDKAFYDLLNAGERLHKLSHKVKYAGNLIRLNKIKQNKIQSLFREEGE